MKNEINKTAHSTYRCEYHIVFAPKYRRQIVYVHCSLGVGLYLNGYVNINMVKINDALAITIS